MQKNIQIICACFHILGSVLDKWEKARISNLRSEEKKLKLRNATVKAVVCGFPLDEGDVFHSSDTNNFHYQRFYFNKEVGSCQEFEYLGSGGNMNNFKTFEECQTICGHFEGM